MYPGLYNCNPWLNIVHVLLYNIDIYSTIHKEKRYWGVSSIIIDHFVNMWVWWEDCFPDTESGIGGQTACSCWLHNRLQLHILTWSFCGHFFYCLPFFTLRLCLVHIHRSLLTCVNTLKLGTRIMISDLLPTLVVYNSIHIICKSMIEILKNPMIIFEWFPKDFHVLVQVNNWQTQIQFN